MSDLEGKVAVITGGANGIGLACAQKLSDEGANIVIADIDLAAAEKRADELPTDSLGVHLDVRDSASANELASTVLREYGRVDILVNNAGLSWGEAPESMPLEKWHKVIDANLTGAFLFSQEAGRIMLEQEKGCIINIASVAGLHASVNGPHYVGYAASKAGLMGLTRELAASWGRRGIRVNAIAPGFFHSRLADVAIPLAEPAIKAFSPIPRVGAVGELKGVAVFLAADASSYITGQVIVVDGGRTIA